MFGNWKRLYQRKGCRQKIKGRWTFPDANCQSFDLKWKFQWHLSKHQISCFERESSSFQFCKTGLCLPLTLMYMYRKQFCNNAGSCDSVFSNLASKIRFFICLFWAHWRVALGWWWSGSNSSSHNHLVREKSRFRVTRVEIKEEERRRWGVRGKRREDRRRKERGRDGRKWRKGTIWWHSAQCTGYFHVRFGLVSTKPSFNREH